MKPAAAFRSPALVLALAALAAAATAAHAAEAPRFAWGKAGVSYDQYRSEAYECALDGLSVDVSDTEPVERLRRATRQMEAIEARQGAAAAADPVAAGIRQAQDIEAARASARPDQQVQAVKRIMFSAMQRCMIQRGYTRFALTEEQRGEMAALADGSPERRALLHRLASDAGILERQRHDLPAE